MKKIVLMLLLSLSSLFAVNFVDDFDKGMELAKKDNKKVLLFYTQVGCPACEYMEDVVFTNETVSNYLDTYYIVIHLDVYKQGMQKGYKAYGTPTMYFLDKDGNEITKKVVGGLSVTDFLSKIKSTN